MSYYNYTRKVINRGGYIVMTPGVESLAELRGANDINPYAETALQEWPLGTKLINGERVWRYGKTGGTGLAIAAPAQAPAQVHADQFPDLAVGAVAAIGATAIEVTSTANVGAPWSTANGGAEGYILTQDLTGESQMHKIVSHDAFSGTANSTVNLYDPLVTALDATTQCGLMENPYANMIVAGAVLTGIFIGVPLFTTTTLYYHWIQTGGPAPGIPQAAISVGDMVVVGTTSGKFNAFSAFTTEAIVGYAMTLATTDTEAFMVFLTSDR